MAEAHQILSQLPSEEIETLLTRVMAFALRRLGTRATGVTRDEPGGFTSRGDE